MDMMKRRVGIYLDVDQVLQHPRYIEALRERLGLNLVILGFTGILPQAVRATSPFDGYPVSDARLHELLCTHVDGYPSYGAAGAHVLANEKRMIGPNAAAMGDDARLNQAIAFVHSTGCKVWLLSGGWTVNDFNVLMYCPSEPALMEWFGALYTHLATAYGADGLDVTHARYIMTSHMRGLGLCACARCARAAAAFGYDMVAMVSDLRDGVARLARADARRLSEVVSLGFSALDVMQFLGLRPGVMQWFDFRCRLLERNVATLRDVVHEAAGEAFVFGTDTYPASLSLLAGHNHTRFGEFSDFASPLLSHVNIFPMETMVVWTQWLRALQPELSEETALRLAYRMGGYDGLDMPRMVEEFGFGGRPLTGKWYGEPDCEWRHNPLREMLRLDMIKARLMLPADLPSYPIIQGGGAPHDWPREIIDGVVADAYDTGHQGYVLQGSSQLLDDADWR